MFKRTLLITSLALFPLHSAYADWDEYRGHGRDRGWERHHEREYRRPRTSVSFNFGPNPYYYRQHYYGPQQVFYAPPAPAPQVIYINDNNSREISSNDGRYCREYQNTSRVGGSLQKTYGTACMQPDGSWEII